MAVGRAESSIERTRLFELENEKHQENHDDDGVGGSAPAARENVPREVIAEIGKATAGSVEKAEQLDQFVAA